MKKGDLVQNGQGHTGIVTGVGYSGGCPSTERGPFVNPDIHVVTPVGHCVWSYNALEVISESR